MADRSRSRSPRNQEMPLEATPLTYADLVVANRNLIQQNARWETENEGLKAELHSRKYFKVEALPENARAALEVVCKHDADPRVESQRRTIVDQAKRIAELKAERMVDVAWHEGCMTRREALIQRLKDSMISHTNALRESWRKILRNEMEIDDLKREVERLEVELAGCSKCKGSASGTYGRLCEDCYFEEHPSEEESS